MYIYIYINICVYIHIVYIYIYREREREGDVYIKRDLLTRHQQAYLSYICCSALLMWLRIEAPCGTNMTPARDPKQGL